MIEWALILAGGFLGSSHCLGMCGPFAVMIGAASRSPRDNLARQVIYGVGRVFTYSTLGAAVGFGGWRLVQALPWLTHLPAALSALAGVLLIYYGLRTAGVLPQRAVMGASSSCLPLASLRQLFRAPHASQVFLAGVLTGLLPCGLTYAFLTLAASAAHMARGGLTMMVFGIGTMPAMILAGCSGSLMSVVARQRIVRIAAWCVVATGALCLWRAAATLDMFGGRACPYCDP